VLEFFNFPVVYDGVAKTSRIWVGNPDALYRDFSPNILFSGAVVGV